MFKIIISKFFLLSLTSVILFTSCEKDDNVAPPTNATKLLFNWKITNITTPKVGQPTVDSSLLKPCMSDDIIKFATTGFDFQDGAVKCDSTIFNYAKGNWGYKTAGDSIQLAAVNPAKYVSWKVLLLNDSVLQIRYIDSTIPAKKIQKTISFKH